MAAPNVSREHRPFFSFRFPFSVVSGPSCQQFRTLFRSSFRLQRKIPYLIPEFIFLFFSWVLCTAGFSVFSAFSGFQGSRSGIPVFPCFPLFPPFPVFRGPNPEFRFFPFFPLFRAPNPEFRGHGSGHVWCGHVWRAPTTLAKFPFLCPPNTGKLAILKLFLSQPQSITQKGVHTDLSTPREREHCWFL